MRGRQRGRRRRECGAGRGSEVEEVCGGEGEGRPRRRAITFLLWAHWCGSSLLLLMMFVAAPWLSSTDTMEAATNISNFNTKGRD